MEYTLNFQIKLDFDKFSDEDKLRAFEDYLSRKINCGKIFDVSLKSDSTSSKEEKSKFHAEFSLDEVFSKLTESKERIKFEKNGKYYFIRMNSQRYFLFKTNQTCVSCGLKGTRFFVEKDPGSPHHHFNLYGEENNNLVLFTKDHVLAKANGGTDQYSNYQVMCSICNNLKGSYPLSPEKVKVLRDFYNQSTDRKNPSFVHAVNQKRMKLLENSEPVATKAKKEDIIHPISDLKIVRTKSGGLIGLKMKSECDGDLIACVGHNQKLEIIEVDKKNIKIKFNDEFYEIRKDLTNFIAICKEVKKHILGVRKILKNVYMKRAAETLFNEQHAFDSHTNHFFEHVEYINNFRKVSANVETISDRLNLIEKKNFSQFSLEELRFFSDCFNLVTFKNKDLACFVEKWDKEFKFPAQTGIIE